MKGSAIIEVWNKAKVELEDLLSGMRNEHYVGNILARHGFIVRNSIFDSCWFSKNGVILHIKRDCDTEKWVLTEYIGLRGEVLDERGLRGIKANYIIFVFNFANIT